MQIAYDFEEIGKESRKITLYSEDISTMNIS